MTADTAAQMAARAAIRHLRNSQAEGWSLLARVDEIERALPGMSTAERAEAAEALVKMARSVLSSSLEMLRSTIEAAERQQQLDATHHRVMREIDAWSSAIGIKDHGGPSHKA